MVDALYRAAIAYELSKTNVVHLGAILNYATFVYEFQGQKELATHMAKCAFDDGIYELDMCDEDEYRGAAAILQGLKCWIEECVEIDRVETSQ